MQVRSWRRRVAGLILLVTALFVGQRFLLHPGLAHVELEIVLGAPYRDVEILVLGAAADDVEATSRVASAGPTLTVRTRLAPGEHRLRAEAWGPAGVRRAEASVRVEGDGKLRVDLSRQLGAAP